VTTPASTPLASSSGGSDAEWRALLDVVAERRGFRCADYKDKCVRRRVAVRMRARGVHRYLDYASLVSADEREMSTLVDTLTINVTKLFRNLEVFAAIGEQVLPRVWAPGAPLRIWSAGTASGDEAVSLAILAHRFAQASNRSRELGAVRVLGTDIDDESLRRARAGVYSDASLVDVDAETRDRYFAGPPTGQVDLEIASRIEYRRHDLLAEPAPGRFEITLCRNVLIYFSRAAQEAVLELLVRSLVPGGALVLGKVESVTGPAREMLAPEDARLRIYRRIA
jgi:chemotaxis methyl-accepting protein methylase